MPHKNIFEHLEKIRCNLSTTFIRIFVAFVLSALVAINIHFKLQARQSVYDLRKNSGINNHVVRGLDQIVATEVLESTFCSSNPSCFSIRNLRPLLETKFKGKDLVLGMAENIDTQNFAVFAGSLRSVSPTVEAIILVNSDIQDHRLLSLSEQYRVHLVVYNRANLEPSIVRTFHPSSLRWVLLHYLLAQGSPPLRERFEYMVLLDIRDSYFQLNPFEYLRSMPSKAQNNLLVFAEDAGPAIGSCGWNSGWIRDCFGDRILSLVSNNPIICSGVSMGSSEIVSTYIRLMSMTFLGKADLGSQFFPQCERNGVDQGIHNVVVHLNLIKNITIMHEVDAPAVNLQTSYIDPNLNHANITRSDGALFHIVHQYDRMTHFQDVIRKRFVDWIDFSTPQSEFVGTPECKRFQLFTDADLFKGVCDLKSARVMSAATCCGVCNSDESCTAFTYVDGVCYMKSCDFNTLSSIVTPFLKSGNVTMDLYMPGAMSAARLL